MHCTRLISCKIGRALDAPQISRLFSYLLADTEYRRFRGLSEGIEARDVMYEPRAALILNRFTRSLSIMHATSGVEQILGLSPEQLHQRSFYDFVQEGCLNDAVDCFEGAKAQDSIVSLRFQLRQHCITAQSQFPPFEVDAVVSCTSDGLVVIIQRAKPYGKSYWNTHGLEEGFATMINVGRTAHAQQAYEQLDLSHNQTTLEWEAMDVNVRSRPVRGGNRFPKRGAALINTASAWELHSVRDLCRRLAGSPNRPREHGGCNEHSKRRRRRSASCSCNDCERLWGSCPSGAFFGQQYQQPGRSIEHRDYEEEIMESRVWPGAGFQFVQASTPDDAQAGNGCLSYRHGLCCCRASQELL
jgi:hypothetical protein